MADRGEYRSIRRVLLDGPDFQRLSAEARWCFVALKLNAGPTGFDVYYASALAGQLEAQTGLNLSDVTDAIDELDRHGWIRREGNLLWIVGHLPNDPHMSPADIKHRKAVQRHVASLPRIALVRAFVAAHPLFFPPLEAQSMGLAWAMEGPSMTHRSTESESESENESETESEKKSEEERGPTIPAVSAPPASDPSAPLAQSIGELGPDVRQYLAIFWPKDTTPLARRREVAREVLATLNGGAVLNGQRVIAYSRERLARKCREVLNSKVRDPDKANAILLAKLADTSDLSAANDLPGQREAESLKPKGALDPSVEQLVSGVAAARTLPAKPPKTP